jgi:hypothetical protein
MIRLLKNILLFRIPGGEVIGLLFWLIFILLMFRIFKK